VIGEVLTVAYPCITVREACEERDEPAGGRIEYCKPRRCCRCYRIPSFVMRGLDFELAPVQHGLLQVPGGVACGST
jgi:hypothetical protein